jgi:hypothetical protein
MRRALSGAVVAACLVGSLAFTGPALAGGVNPRVARSSCAIMGLSVADLRPYYGKVTETFAGYACGVTADKFEVTFYLYPIGETAAVTKEVGLVHGKRLGGLGAGAVFRNDGGGVYGLVLSGGKYCVYIDGQSVVSQPVLIQLAHIIHRALT